MRYTPARVEEFVLVTDRIRKLNSNGTSDAKLAYWFQRSDSFIVVLRLSEVKMSGRSHAYWTVNRVQKDSRHSEVLTLPSGQFCFDLKRDALSFAIGKEFE